MWSTFTPARVFTALGASTGGTSIALTAAHGPMWLILVLGAVNLFCVALVATSGPVQQSAEEHKIASAAVQAAKENT